MAPAGAVVLLLHSIRIVLKSASPDGAHGTLRPRVGRGEGAQYSVSFQSLEMEEECCWSQNARVQSSYNEVIVITSLQHFDLQGNKRKKKGPEEKDTKEEFNKFVIKLPNGAEVSQKLL